jgi:anion-transporting  ArsA/GET3 family ATPase
MSGSKGLDQLLTAKGIVVCCGSGGVGKTTTAAAAATMAAVNRDLKVLVITVDPAKRLANALGMERFGNTETRVDPAAFAKAGVEPAGELWAAMLDTKQSWDDLIEQHAPDERTRDDILGNALYRNISGRFVQSHDYVAMERLYQIHQSGRYDLIVVDTPPTRNAVDFLDAPQRMADFFSSRLLRWLIAPYRSRVVNLASKPFYSVADRILGTKFLQDISEFFILFQSMYDGFVERARAVSALLASPETSFIVVSTLETAPAQEAAFFLEELYERHFPVGGLVLNKALPPWLADPTSTRLARSVTTKDDAALELVRSLEAQGTTPDGAPEDSLVRLIQDLGRNYLRYQVVASRESEEADVLRKDVELAVSVPFFAEDIGDLAGLLRVGQWLWNPANN